MTSWSVQTFIDTIRSGAGAASAATAAEQSSSSAAPAARRTPPRSRATERHPDAGIGADAGRIDGENLLLVLVEPVLHPAAQFLAVGQPVEPLDIPQNHI